MAKRGKGAERHKHDSGGSPKQDTGFTAQTIRDPPGTATVHVFDPRTRETQTLDMSDWLSVGPLAEVVIEGFRRTCLSTRRSTTRRSRCQDLGNGFLQFCLERQARLGRDLDWNDFSKTTMNEYVAWLTRRLSDEGKPLAKQTRMHYLGHVRKLAAALREDLSERGIDAAIPDNPWPREKDNSLKTEPLDEGVYRDLIIYVGEITLQLALEVLPLLDEVISIRRDGPVPKPPFATAAQCCAFVLNENDGLFPERKDLDPSTRKMVDSFGYTKLRRVVYPQVNDIIAPLLLLACFTGLNQQPLTALRFGDIGVTEIFGKLRTVLSPPKFRAAGKRQRCVFVQTDEILNPANVLDFVIKWTSVIRENAPEHVKDHVFLCANKWKGDGEWIRSLGEPENGRFVATSNAIYNFLRPRFKTYIGTRLLRASFAEHLNQLLGGDLESVGILLGHGSISVTAGSYRSSQARSRDELALAGGMLARDRMVASKGKIDPRSESPTMDRTSATPGWDCLDPFDSPIPGQVYGRPCTAFGHCPGCELGSRCRDRVLSLARSLQLLERMHEAQDEIGVVAFDKQFGKPFRTLTEVDIPELSTPENIEAVKRLSLNPLPSLL